MWINNQEFLISDKDIPNIPAKFSLDARQFWQEQKKRCIEGYMVGGKWMSPNLYFYLNFWKIQLTRGKSKSKVIAKPELRDIEWLIYPAWSLCRGLNGFKNGYKLADIAEQKGIKNPLADDYINLLTYPGKDYGTPQYENQALDLLLVGPREFGKSYISAGGIIGHEWLFNGEKEYILPHERINTIEDTVATIVVGAGDSSYSKDLLNKFKIGYDELAKGGIEFNGKYYPHPFFQSYTGSLAPGKSLIAEYKKKLGGKWIYDGTKSMIKHVSYKDNPFAGQGTRASVMAKEEIGEFDNLEEARENDKETMMNGANKSGSCLYTGCVCAGTKIWTKDGRYINIEDLKQEEGIIGYDTNSISFEEITYLKPPATKPCYKITTISGTILECSEDHPLLWSKPGFKYSIRKTIKNKRVYEGDLKKVTFKETKNIKKGDHLAFINSVPIFGKQKMWYPRLIGMLIGDGSYGSNKTPVLSNCDSEINNYIDNNFDVVIEKSYLTKTNKLYRETRIKNICNNLRDLGIYGQTKLKKTLPINIHLYDKESICELIAGLIDTDGMVKVFPNNKGVFVKISSVSKELLTEIKYLCVKLGIHGTINESKPYIEKCKNKTIKQLNSCFNLVIADKHSVFNLCKNIKLLCKYKQDKLYLAQRFILNSKRKNDGIFVSKSNTDKSSIKITNLSGLRFQTVKSVEYIGEKEVYNLTAGTTHTYIANNIITHNTGGNMNRGTLGLYKFMYDPKTYNMLAFSDKWENKGNIGMFIPATMRSNETKDQNGNTNHEVETIRILKVRQELKEGKDSSNALRKEIIYNPLVPSEIFLRGGINRFPIGEIKETLAALETQKIWKDAEYIGKITVSPTGKMEWKLDPTIEPIRNFPLRSHEDKKGGICIYEQPKEIEGKILDYMYIAGIDPYDFDEAKHSNSLGSTFIYNRITHRIVAEYTARPELSDTYYENVRRLLLYYNATAMYENDKKGLFTYFSNKHSLHLLAPTPKIFKDMVPNSKVNRDGKGLHSTLEGNRTGYDFIKRWLLESASDPDNPEILQVHKLRSPALCNELILFDEENGNFDRVSALVMLFWYVEELRKYDITLEINTEKPKADDFFSRKMFVNRKNAFS